MIITIVIIIIIKLMSESMLQYTLHKKEHYFEIKGVLKTIKATTHRHIFLSKALSIPYKWVSG